jgi:hypothetical protein
MRMLFLIRKGVPLSVLREFCSQMLSSRKTGQKKKGSTDCVRKAYSWWARKDLNLGPTDYEF